MDFNLLIQKIESLPSLPQAYHKCCFLLERNVTDSKDLAQVVATDPSMTIAVLRLVNSAFYNLPRKIERLDHAISIIGHNKFRDLILTASVVKAMTNLASGAVDMEVFWRHSIFTGLVAKRLGLHAYLPNSERLFIAGLLHDIGELIYFDMLETKALKVSELVCKYGIDISIAETKVFGFTHQLLGSELCKAWDLPEWLEQIVLHHHQPKNALYHKHEATILLLANSIAEQHFPGLSSLGKILKTDNLQTDNPRYWAAINVDSQMQEQVVNDVSLQIESVMESLIPDLNCVS